MLRYLRWSSLIRSLSPVVGACLLLMASAIHLSSARAVDGPSQRVLLLYPYNETFPSSTLAGGAARKSLEQSLAGRIEIYSDFLDLARFPGEEFRHIRAKHLADKYARTRLDLVMALDVEALRFAAAHRDVFGPEVPIVFCCTSAESLASSTGALPDKILGVVSDYDLRRTVELASKLQPEARRLVVVGGASDVDRRWETRARAQLAAYEGRFETTYLLGLPRQLLLDQVSRLPQDAIVLTLTLFMDREGQRFIPRDIIEEVANASSAPVYSLWETVLGRGVVGGYMDSFEAAGQAAADLSLSILRGEDPGLLPRMTKIEHRNVVDARQLARWRLSEARLPAGSIVLFKEQTIWERHRGIVMGTAAVFSLMAVTLLILALQIRKRRRAEAQLKASEERLGFAAASADIGLWQYDIAADFLWSSTHCRLMFGLPANHPLTTAELIDSAHPADRSVAVASVRAASYGALTTEQSEFRVVQPDGRIRWLQARGCTTLDSNGRPTLVSGIFRDITSYKAAELEARQLSQRVLTIQDEERERIAQELHDSTAQHLAAIGLNLIAIQGANSSKRNTSRIFADIERSLAEAARELRTFTYLLHPPALADDGLVATLHQYAEGFSRRTGLNVAIRAEIPDAELSPSLQHSLLRIVQEALANVHRHASANRVSVRLRRVDSGLHLIIRDNGHGFPSENSGGSRKLSSLPVIGVGMAGMSARARQFGGRLAIRSSSMGTSVHIVLPIVANLAPSLHAAE
jgi:PAS domain S-box-containing protein